MLLYKSNLEKAIKNPLRASSRIKLSDITTYGLGGEIRQCFFPKTPYQARKIYSQLLSRGERVAIVGNGSDILGADSGFDGCVICLRKMKGIIRAGSIKLLCLAGTSISSILAYCKKHNLSGMEYMYGIPASIGGAAYMNAGVGDFTISRNIVNVHCIGDFNGILSQKECNFSRKHSTMRDINCIITAVTLNLDSSTADEIQSKTDYFISKRAHLPKGRSCGCVFVNGSDYISGELIDKCGLKGVRCGGAYISRAHANFIINEGTSAADVRTLIDLAKRRVFEKFGVAMREEVVYIGDFNDFNG